MPELLPKKDFSYMALLYLAFCPSVRRYTIHINGLYSHDGHTKGKIMSVAEIELTRQIVGLIALCFIVWMVLK